MRSCVVCVPEEKVFGHDVISICSRLVWQTSDRV